MMPVWMYKNCSVYVSEGESTLPVIWMHTSQETAAELARRLKDVPVRIAAVDGVDWNADLTPWSAKAVFRGQPDFGGRAGEYLAELTQTILPGVQETLELCPVYHAIAGYSLAGMFALYAAVNCDVFRKMASVSGSIWYPDFVEYLEKNENLRTPRRAYFSVGDREKLSRNPSFRKIDECTLRAEEILRSRGSETIFETNPGSHFDDPTGRMERAVRWLLHEEENEKENSCTGFGACGCSRCMDRMGQYGD